MPNVSVNSNQLEKAYELIAGRVWYSIDQGLSLDDLDAERIREAGYLLHQMMIDAKEVK